MNATPITGSSTPETTPHAEMLALLPAMALSARDLPDGFRLLGERFETAEGVSTLLIHGHKPAQDLLDNGLVSHYESAYLELEGNLVIRTYVALFASDGEASKSFKLVAAPRRIGLPSGSEAARDLEDFGDGKAMLASGRTTGIRGNAVNASDVTFRIGNLLAGVTLEKPAHGPVANEDDTIAFARALETRVRALLAGETIEQLDIRLARTMLPLQNLANATVVQDGFLDRLDVVGTGGADGFVSCYLRGATLLEGATNPFSRPFLGAIITTFETADDAMAFATNRVSLWPDEKARMIENPTAAGVDWIAGMKATTQRSGGGSENKWRLMAVIADTVVVIETDGFGKQEYAEALLAAQVACLAGDGVCTEVPEA